MRRLSFLAAEKTLLCGFFIALSQGAWAQDEKPGARYPKSFQNRVAVTASSHEWWRLLHYRKSVMGILGTVSEVGGDPFFVSADGKTSPEAELWANFEGFQSGRGFKRYGGKPLRCIFPLRYRFIKKSLGMKLAKVSCPEYDKWRKEINGDSVSLVFSGYYAGAPASMFGHTFLRIDRWKGDKGGGTPLLNKAVDYAAQVGKDGVILQSLLGLFGGYQGRYSVWPYYVKVKEYNNAENRDIFEYHLDFDRAEVDRLLAHVWEVGRSSSPYYFLKRNCSYELLSVLEVAKLDWDLSSGFYLYSIPVDTLLRVTQIPGAVEKITYRPSQALKMETRWAGLNGDERDQVGDYIDGKIEASSIKEPKVAEAINQYYMMKQIAEAGKLEPELAKRFRQSLLRRSKLPKTPDPTKNLSFVPPDAGHFVSRWGAGLGVNEHGQFADLEFRPGLHDMLAWDEGYEPFSALEMGRGRIRLHLETGEAYFRDFVIGRVASFSPLGGFENRRSYEVEMSVRTPRDGACTECQTFYNGGGMGISFDAFERRWVAYGLLGAQVEVGSSLLKGWRYGPNARLGTAMRLGPYKMLLRQAFNVHLFRDNPWSWEAEWGHGFKFARNWEARLIGQRTQGEGFVRHEGRVEAFFYF